MSAHIITKYTYDGNVGKRVFNSERHAHLIENGHALFSHGKPVEPFEVVKMFFDGFTLDFWALGNYILKIYGYVPRTDMNTIKKP